MVQRVNHGFPSAVGGRVHVLRCHRTEEEEEGEVVTRARDRNDVTIGIQRTASTYPVAISIAALCEMKRISIIFHASINGVSNADVL